jgi:hypothetical protein
MDVKGGVDLENSLGSSRENDPMQDELAGEKKWKRRRCHPKGGANIFPGFVYRESWSFKENPNKVRMIAAFVIDSA